MTTFSAKSHEVNRQWHVFDAKEHTIGRLAANVAKILQGKHKPTYTPHVDTGDYVVITNAKEVLATGNKEEKKVYYRHTGYIGGIKSRTLAEMRDRQPEKIIELAVKNMLPKGPLGRQMFKKLRVYAGSEHPHQGQVTN